jgi:hypothetical protein
MVLEKPVKKELAKIEALKIESDYLLVPLKKASCTGGVTYDACLFLGLSAFGKVVFVGGGSYRIAEVMNLFFPRLIDICRRTERPRPISQWTFWGKL